MSQVITTTPKLTLSVAEIERELLPELQAYHAIYAGLFKRREQRVESEKYLKGLLSEIENKSVESMVLQFEGDNPNAIRASQQFLGQGAWSDEAILRRHWQEVSRDLGYFKEISIRDYVIKVRSKKRSVRWN